MEQDDKQPSCPNCAGNKRLVPMRWIQICPKGHLGDVDWFRWAHQGAGKADQRQCQVHNKLRFETSSTGGSGGLDTLAIGCRVCGARKGLMGISSPETISRMGFKCSGRQPWQRFNEVVACDEGVRITQRGASNVYFPVVHSSIEIPNASSSVAHSEIALELLNDPLLEAILSAEDGQVVSEFLINQIVEDRAVDEAFLRGLVKDERRKRDGLGTVVEATPGDLLGEEWAAFLTPTDDPDHPDFVTRHVGLGVAADERETPILDVLADRVSRVVVADRLREVRALQGFHRVTPAPGTMVPVDLGKGLPWLPAIEVRGEGIFLALDEPRLTAWEGLEPVSERAKQLSIRLNKSFQRDRLQKQTGPILAPRYLLLHTLAHLLIRRLAFETGYAAASLRERVYAKSAKDGSESARQAGVLIYTAAGDSEGTLGGLVRQGEPPRFVNTLIEAIQDGAWCSSDPLCVESQATSFDSLNLAACHACCLISETSCESGNFLLDRVMVVGNDVVPGFFGDVVDSVLVAASEAAE